MKNFKSMYNFNVLVDQEIEESVKQIDPETKEEITVIKKVKREVPRRVALRKPTRVLFDESELYYNVQVSKGLEAGLMSQALLAKRFDNDGGIWSDPDKEEYSRIHKELRELIKKSGQLSLKEDSSKTPEEKTQSEEIEKQILALGEKLRQYELTKVSLYDITAESHARTKTIIWWMLNVAFALKKEAVDPNDQEWEPLYKGATFKERMDDYYRVEEGEGISDEDKQFYLKATRKALAATAFWYYGKASNQEAFEALEKQIDQG